jgi:hypothetical protein
MYRILDLVLAAWIIFVAAVYFGPLVWPPLGLMTTSFSAVYAAVLIVAVVGHYLNRKSRHG